MQVTEAANWRTKLIAPFVNSTSSVLTTMAHVPTKVGQLFVKTGSEPRHDVSGIISFSGGVTGSVVIGMNTEVAIRIIASFAGTRFEPDSPDFADAMGELANMIAGNAKRNMGVNASISIPTVIIGPNHQTARMTGVPCVVIPCVTDCGNFEVEVNIKQTNSN
jgi:chemotaxis protein CheX